LNRLLRLLDVLRYGSEILTHPTLPNKLGVLFHNCVASSGIPIPTNTAAISKLN
jgi:hypothetical protein